jgi:hypothetical protein
MNSIETFAPVNAVPAPSVIGKATLHLGAAEGFIGGFAVSVIVWDTFAVPTTTEVSAGDWKLLGGATRTE